MKTKIYIFIKKRDESVRGASFNELMNVAWVKYYIKYPGLYSRVRCSEYDALGLSICRELKYTTKCHIIDIYNAMYQIAYITVSTSPNPNLLTRCWILYLYLPAQLLWKAMKRRSGGMKTVHRSSRKQSICIPEPMLHTRDEIK